MNNPHDLGLIVKTAAMLMSQKALPIRNSYSGVETINDLSDEEKDLVRYHVVLAKQVITEANKQR